MPSTDYRAILRRVGFVLVVVGLLDIGLMIYTIMNRFSHSSSMNIFAVIAGLFLIRGSLRAASVVRWAASFSIAAAISIVLISPLLQPVGLTYTLFQVNPVAVLGSVGSLAVTVVLLVWLVRQLGSSPVAIARANAGRPSRDMRIPVTLGVALAVVLAMVSFGVQRSDSAARAMREAQAQLGAEYRFHVSSLNYRSTGEGTFVSGVVTAWKSGTVKELPFQWRE